MTHRRASIRFAVACLSAGFVALGTADAAPSKNLTTAAAARIREGVGADARVSVNPATGVARFVSVPAGRPADLAPVAGAPAQKAAAFFGQYADAFGIRNAAGELSLKKTTTDQTGMTHLDFAQVYEGVPVFAGVLKAHFDAAGALRTVNGTFVPGINLSPVARVAASDAGRIALARVKEQKSPATAPAVLATKLYVYRTGLAQGVAGQNHLAYEVEVGNKKDVREFVYVDAHTSRIIDQVSGVNEALTRRVYDGGYGPTFVVWNEGDPFPTPDVDINNIITFTSDTYGMYLDTFGRDTHTGQGTLMETVNDDPTIQCPNANWNGISTNYCTGVTGDDTVAHEWTHAYTQYTHGLIYAWQPGALNESFSDIFGEIVDARNGQNVPDNPRVVGQCSQFGGAQPPTFTVNGGSAAGSYQAAASVNEPAAGTYGPTAMAVAVPASACSTVTGVAGAFAIVDWTLNPDGSNECGSVARATNAMNAGAVGVIFVAPPAGFLSLSSIAAIPSVQISSTNGDLIKAGLPATSTIVLNVGVENSYRWLSGEDDTATGAIRDLWNPTCFGDPANVSAGFYTCAAADGGGVHTNSGVPNHGFALLTDGGTFNGHTVAGIGMTKAAHVYFRAMTTYQHPATDFADHADALEQSCADLVGQSVTDLFGGAPQTISASDCTQVAEMTAAIAFRTPPTFCNFQPMLQAGDPPLCPAGGGLPQTFFFDDFESAPANWTFGTYGTTPDFTPRAWSWRDTLPSGRRGSAFFGTDPDIGTCAAGGDESGVITLTSPNVTVPAGSSPRLAFDHWMSTEAPWDGGNVKISVNGGPFTLVADADFTFNSYNAAIDPTSTNPLFGQAAFTGGDGGSVSGSWARSLVNLAPYAAAGDTVQLRYDMGTDGCTGFFGWYVDDVRLYSCTAATGTPALAIGDASVVEGNAGTTDLVLPVTLSTASATPVTVDYATADGSATSGDYTPTTGTLTFAPGELSHGVTVSVVGDTTFEPNEFFFANLSAASGATILDGQGVGTIVNDDTVTAAGGARSEIIHGTRVQKALTPVGTVAGADFYYVANQPFTSYEVVVDATSGDLGTAGPELTRVASDGSTVLQSSNPVGTGSSRTLRWTSTAAGNEYVRVRSTTCTTDCGADDVYRLRAYETTYSIPRFNNSGTQVTVLLLQNPTSEPVTGHIYFWDAAGTQLHDEPVSLAPKALLVFNSAGVGTLTGQSGTITVTHDGAYGALAGKSVALEPATGFSFDSPMAPRSR
jgi:Zn-dependent metalloprotease